MRNNLPKTLVFFRLVFVFSLYIRFNICTSKSLFKKNIHLFWVRLQFSRILQGLKTLCRLLESPANKLEHCYR